MKFHYLYLLPMLVLIVLISGCVEIQDTGGFSYVQESKELGELCVATPECKTGICEGSEGNKVCIESEGREIGQKCEYDQECKSSYCNSGDDVCEAGKGVGEPCISSQECRSDDFRGHKSACGNNEGVYVCLNESEIIGELNSPCILNTDCKQGLSCREVDGFYKCANTITRVDIGESCNDYQICKPGLICGVDEYGQSICFKEKSKINSDRCDITKKGECMDGLICRNTCVEAFPNTDPNLYNKMVEVGEGGECKHDLNCIPPLFCGRGTLKEFVCTSKKELNARCAYGAECLSGLCGADKTGLRICETPKSNKEVERCKFDEECEVGLKCSDGFLGINYLGFKYRGFGACIRPESKAEGESCFSHEECQTGLCGRTTENKFICKTSYSGKLGEVCLSEKECESNYCYDHPSPRIDQEVCTEEIISA